MTNDRDRQSYFESPTSWEAAEAMLTFRPSQPRHVAGFNLESLAVHMRDHKKRELPPGGRTLEAHYGGFVLTQTRSKKNEARRQALNVAYGAAARSATVAGHEARAYELGPECPPDDVDGRTPAVVAWHDGEMFFLIASDRLSTEALLGIAGSMYDPDASA